MLLLPVSPAAPSRSDEIHFLMGRLAFFSFFSFFFGLSAFLPLLSVQLFCFVSSHGDELFLWILPTSSPYPRSPLVAPAVQIWY